MLTAYLLSVLLISKAPPLEGDIGSSWPIIVVRARAEKVVYHSDNGEWQDVTFRIEHVYRGDAKFKGKTFKEHAWHPGSVPASPQLELWPLVKKGELGIWELEWNDEDGLTPIVHNQGTHKEDGLYRWNIALPVPARKIVGGSANNIDYYAALDWARFVETVTHADRADQPKLLRKNISSTNPYVSAWALRTLLRYNPPDLRAFLRDLADNPKLSMSVQVAVDELLCEIDLSNWRKSKQRQRLFERWISGDIIEPRDVYMIAAHIHHALMWNGSPEGKAKEFSTNLDWEVWLPLMEKWVVNQHLSQAFEDRLYDIYGSGIISKERRAEARDQIVAYSVHLLKRAPDESRQLFAAKWLAQFDDLTNEQVGAVRELKKKISNVRVLQQLNIALEMSARR